MGGTSGLENGNRSTTSTNPISQPGAQVGRRLPSADVWHARESALCTHHGVNRTAQHEDRTGGTRTALEDLHHGQGHRRRDTRRAESARVHFKRACRQQKSQDTGSQRRRGGVAGINTDPKEGNGRQGTAVKDTETREPTKTLGRAGPQGQGGPPETRKQRHPVQKPPGTWQVRMLIPRKAPEVRELKLCKPC